MKEMKRRGLKNHHTLAYQSRVGPVEWLQPYTDDTIRCGDVWECAGRGLWVWVNERCGAWV
jgi:hypothetical protein